MYLQLWRERNRRTVPREKWMQEEERRSQQCIPKNQIVYNAGRFETKLLDYGVIFCFHLTILL